jgi:hypothetical protein
MTAGTGLESLWDEKRRSYNNGYEAGLEVAEERYRPLIEAARAYRDAKAAFDMAGPPSAVHATGEELLDARDELCEAARTFEVSHEGQG